MLRKWLLSIVAFFLLLVGYILIRDYYREQQPPPDVVVVPAPTAPSIKPRPTREPRPEPTARPAPPPPPPSTPRPTPMPAFSIRQDGNSQWIVTVPKGEWYDTGIPIITNHEVNLRGSDRGKWIVRLNGMDSFSNEGCWGGKFTERSTPSYHLGENVDCAIRSAMHSYIKPSDYKSTISIKVANDSAIAVMQIRVLVSREYTNECPSLRSNVARGGYISDAHSQIHDESRSWARGMRQKIANY